MSGKSYAHGNHPEATFHDLAAAKGWEVLRGGWPDFALMADGVLRLVEVKSACDDLCDGQVELYEMLGKAGIQVYVWWELTPSRLIPWKRFLEITKRIKKSGYLHRKRPTYKRHK